MTLHWYPVLPVWLVLAGLGLALVLAAVLAVTRPHQRGRWLRRGLLAGLMSLAALNPAAGVTTTQAALADADLTFVVDLSLSMGAEDLPGGEMRLAGVRRDLAALVEAVPGARYAVIGFAAEARQLVPVTTDGQAVVTLARTLTRQTSVYATSSSIAAGHDALQAQLERNLAAHPGRPQVVFYLGDGEQTDPGPVASFADLAEFVAGGAVLQYGTAEGGPIASYEGYGPDDGSCGATGLSRYAHCYVTNANAAEYAGRRSDPVTSHASPENLAALADQLGLPLVDRSYGGVVGGLVASLDVTLAPDPEADRAAALQLYWAFAALAGLLVLWEAAAALGAVRPRRRHVRPS
jgi:Ca-activated chloride channel family protein